MTNDNTFDDKGKPARGKPASAAMHHALTRLPFARAIVARELRLMAGGAAPYAGFAALPLSIRNVWHAAADLLDPPEEGASGEEP